jgi:predicted Rdx family selenoprotein
MAPLNLVIHFEPIEYEDAALALARRLFARFDERIDALTLAPIAEDEFALFLNGILVRSQRQSGQPPRVADVVAILESSHGSS